MVEFPNEQKMQRFAEMISLREPLILNVIGFMDGLGLLTEMTDKKIVQNAYYCGYDSDTAINNVLVFGPDGKVFFLHLIIHGASQMGLSLLVSSCTQKKGLENIKFVLIRDFRGVGM